MKIGFIYSESKLSGKLTKFWTGSYCYHVCIVDEDNGKMYDQHLLFRRRRWPHYDPAQVKLVDSPVNITKEYLENLLDIDENAYGWKDYMLFALRPLYHLFGKSTPNTGGIICSELVYNILVENGWNISMIEVPSPADLENLLIK
jgi:hypothetical protein